MKRSIKSLGEVEQDKTHKKMKIEESNLNDEVITESSSDELEIESSYEDIDQLADLIMQPGKIRAEAISTLLDMVVNDEKDWSKKLIKNLITLVIKEDLEKDVLHAIFRVLTQVDEKHSNYFTDDIWQAVEKYINLKNHNAVTDADISAYDVALICLSAYSDKDIDYLIPKSLLQEMYNGLNAMTLENDMEEIITIFEAFNYFSDTDGELSVPDNVVRLIVEATGNNKVTNFAKVGALQILDVANLSEGNSNYFTESLPQVIRNLQNNELTEYNSDFNDIIAALEETWLEETLSNTIDHNSCDTTLDTTLEESLLLGEDSSSYLFNDN